MTQQPQLPDPEKVKQRVARMREICTMFDAQIMLLDELIAQVEAENRNNRFNIYRREKGKRLLESLMQEKAKEKAENKRDRATQGFIIKLKINAIALNWQMFKQIWQWLVKSFRRWFGIGRSRTTTASIRQEPPPPLSDADLEFLFTQLLEGVHQQRGQAWALQWLKNIEHRVPTERWVEWLQRFGERLLAARTPNNELAARMVQLGELRMGEVGDVSYDIGMQLLMRNPGEPVWEYDGLDA